MIEEPPVRLCCFQRHYGVTCPDGLVMCCHCFDRFPIDQLDRDPDGSYWNVCLECREDERQAMARQDKDLT